MPCMGLYSEGDLDSEFPSWFGPGDQVDLRDVLALPNRLPRHVHHAAAALALQPPAEVVMPQDQGLTGAGGSLVGWLCYV